MGYTDAEIRLFTAALRAEKALETERAAVRLMGPAVRAWGQHRMNSAKTGLYMLISAMDDETLARFAEYRKDNCNA